MSKKRPDISLREVRRYAEGAWHAPETDSLTVEEPLELLIDDKPLAVIMRTPGFERELAVGFLLTEGIVSDVAQIEQIEAVEDVEDVENIENTEAGSDDGNSIRIRLAASAEFDASKFERHFYASSSCGICGKASIEHVMSLSRPIGGRWKIPPKIALALPEALGKCQKIFGATGSLHGAALTNLAGQIAHSAEDVGRHNAVDKIIGMASMASMAKDSEAQSTGKSSPAAKFDFDHSILVVSGRISFEIVQKAMMAGVPMIVAVSGASSLAVDLAEERGMTLAGFVRGGSMTVYNGAWRFENEPKKAT